MKVTLAEALTWMAFFMALTWAIDKITSRHPDRTEWRQIGRIKGLGIYVRTIKKK